MPTPAVARERVVQDFPPEADDGEEQLAAAVNRLADVFEKGFEQMSPAFETVHGFGARCDALCMWLKKRGPWLLASVPVVLTAINALSPQAAKTLTSILTGLGAQ
jgi:hypothetical protein